MSEENTSGQEESAGISQDTGQEPGQEPTSPTGSLTDKILADLEKETPKAASVEDSAASKKEEPKKEEPKEKPLPYDQDPKWKAARAAEKRLTTLMEKHGFDSAEELEEALSQGLSMAEILGNRDAKKLIEDAAYLEEVKAYWKEQDRLKAEEAEEELDPEAREIVKKTKQELADYKKQVAEKERQESESKAIKEALKTYTGVVEKAIETEGISGDEVEIAKLFLGVDNPFNEVDITNKKQVKEMAGQNIKKFKTFLDGVRQKAIDEYAKGKSKITPISPSKATGHEPIPKKELPEGISVDKAFSDATQRILESIQNSVAS